MKLKLLTFIISLAITSQAGSQERTVENRPYTDLRPFHFGVLVGTHRSFIIVLSFCLVF